MKISAKAGGPAVYRNETIGPTCIQEIPDVRDVLA